MRLDSNNVGSFAQSRMAASRVLDWLTPRPTSLLESVLSPCLPFCCRCRRRRSARVSFGCSGSPPVSVDAGRQRPGNTAATRIVPCPFDRLRQQREVPSTLIRAPLARKTAAEIVVGVIATLWRWCRQGATPARLRSGWNIACASSPACQRWWSVRRTRLPPACWSGDQLLLPVLTTDQPVAVHACDLRAARVRRA